MPDAELFQLAGAGRLRSNLSAQVRRMLADPRASALVENFVGQWLQARDIESVPIDARAVLGRENERRADPETEKLRARFRELRGKDAETLTAAERDELAQVRTKLFSGFSRNRRELTAELRQSMRRETEMAFEYVLKENRSVLELIDAEYTFLDERLAGHYGITNITGNTMRRVSLPPEARRGGVLTHGTILAVTSNPTRTSPVKRGLFVLENLLGTPPAPPPPDIPPLEDAAKEIEGRTPTLRETLALHRGQPLCSSCHNRMDPLGLALENYNALGLWRDQESKQPIVIEGQLISGETFFTLEELKRILVTARRADFYRCLTEKLLTYALGRGLEYYDVQTVDTIVEQLEQNHGKPSVLLMGIIESAPFQRRRATGFRAGVQPDAAPQSLAASPSPSSP
jgi:hypothetical protein